jgi:hypothetical protein
MIRTNLRQSRFDQAGKFDLGLSDSRLSKVEELG